jgi:hypothetical protein
VPFLALQAGAAGLQPGRAPAWSGSSLVQGAWAPAGSGSSQPGPGSCPGARAPVQGAFPGPRSSPPRPPRRVQGAGAPAWSGSSLVQGARAPGDTGAPVQQSRAPFPGPGPRSRIQRPAPRVQKPAPGPKAERGWERWPGALGTGATERSPLKFNGNEGATRAKYCKLQSQSSSGKSPS